MTPKVEQPKVEHMPNEWQRRWNAYQDHLKKYPDDNNQWRVFYAGCEAHAPTPAPPTTGTKQQRLSRACEECVSQLALAIRLSGQEMDEAKAADLMYACMRDLFHEVSAPASLRKS